MIKKLRQSDFVRSVATLVSGTVLAQMVTYSLSPVVSRLYTSEEMSYQSLFLRFVTFISIIATARLEMAFNLPKRNEHAYSLFRFSLRLLSWTFGLTLLVSIILFFIPLKDPKLYWVFFAVPFGGLFVSLFTQGTNLALREREFKRISISKMAQSISNSLVTIACFGLDFMGAIIGYTVSLLIGSVFFWNHFSGAHKHMRKYRLKGRDFAIAKSYSEFPRINLPHALIDVTKELFIAFFMLKNFEPQVLGLYDLSYRMLRIPVVMIGSSIGQVFYKKAIDRYNENESFYPVMLQTLKSLILLSIVPFGVLMAFGRPLFGFVFGANWAEAGYYSQIMAPWLMINFLTSPLSLIPTILKKQRIFFYFGLASAVLMVIGLATDYIFPGLHLGFIPILWIVSISQSVLGIITLLWIVKIVRQQHHTVVN